MKSAVNATKINKLSANPLKISTTDIEYLVMEGGGGKGNAFIGALQGLEECYILEYHEFKQLNLKGIGGASAGAITALFLACGYTPEEIEIITTGNVNGHPLEDFSTFFDDPKVGLVPRVGRLKPNTQRSKIPFKKFEIILINIVEMLFRKPVTIMTWVINIPNVINIQDLQDPKKILLHFKKILLHFEKILLYFKSLKEVLLYFKNIESQLKILILLIVLQLILIFYKDQFPSDILNTIKDKKIITAESIYYDYGIFPGKEIHEFFKRWIAIARYRIKNPKEGSPKKGEDIGQALERLRAQYNDKKDKKGQAIRDLNNPTFLEFEQEFNVKFACAGSNLETFKSHIFSGATTPQFYVADAVRISMSLPLAFKPFVIDKKDLLGIGIKGEAAEYLSGVWVDGGLFNNIPLNIFGSEPLDSCDEEKRYQFIQDRTLGLRLEVEKRREIKDLFDFLEIWPISFIMGTGESHISQTYGNYDRSIVLDSEPLTLFSFKPDLKVLKKVTEKSRNKVLEYFGEGN